MVLQSGLFSTEGMFLCRTVEYLHRKFWVLAPLFSLLVLTEDLLEKSSHLENICFPFRFAYDACFYVAFYKITGVYLAKITICRPFGCI
jgi:hypothetical protein